MTFAPLVKYIVFKKVRELPARCEVEDFISCGLEALIASIDRYDPAKGATLEQFAWTRIHGAVLDELRRQDWAPRSLRRWERDIATRARAVHRRCTAAGPRARSSPTRSAISVEELRRREDDISVSDVTSLNTLVISDDETTVERIDTLAASDAAARPRARARRPRRPRTSSAAPSRSCPSASARSPSCSTSRTSRCARSATSSASPRAASARSTRSSSARSSSSCPTTRCCSQPSARTSSPSRRESRARPTNRGQDESRHRTPAPHHHSRRPRRAPRARGSAGPSRARRARRRVADTVELVAARARRRRRCSTRSTPRPSAPPSWPPTNRELHFETDEETGRVIIQVRDLEGNVIRTIPPSDALDDHVRRRAVPWPSLGLSGLASGVDTASIVAS